MKIRCEWCKNSFEEYVRYHDEEWGVSIHDDQKQFEFLILESAQAGLSWSTVLKKRQGYQQAFANFDAKQVAEYGASKVEDLLQNPFIIRNRLKIEAAINNAKKFLDIQQAFSSFDKYIWQFVGGDPIINAWKNMKEVPVTTKESDALSKDLKKRGFKFVGSTIIYAHMQAVGMVNDHTMDCFRYHELTK